VKNLKIAALVPMRHHSQRVTGKNYRLLAGKPLFHYILESLQKCAEVDVIAVNTDSDIIAEDLRLNFPLVVLLKRPTALCANKIPMNEILLYDTQHIKADLYLQTHSTNPFLKPQTISGAIREFCNQSKMYDSLFSVTRFQSRLWDQNARPLNHDPDVLLQTQDLPPVFEENSCIYLFTAEKLRQRRNRLGKKPLMYEIPRDEALDIDEETDFLIAELLMKYRQRV